MCAIFETKAAYLLRTKFLVQTIVITLIYLLALFIVQNFKKIFTTGPKLRRCAIFGPKVVLFPTNIFFWENYYYHSHLPISPFCCANFKKNSSSGFSYEDVPLWAQNGPFPQRKFLFRKPVNGPCFFYSCLSRCQKSKSDINLLVKY